MTKNKLILKFMLLIFFTILFFKGLLTMEISAGEIDNTDIDTKEAVLLSLNEFEKFFGKLPTKFELSVNTEKDKIKITFIKLPQSDTQTDTHGGEVTLVMDKNSGKIIQRLVGQ